MTADTLSYNPLPISTFNRLEGVDHASSTPPTLPFPSSAAIPRQTVWPHLATSSAFGKVTALQVKAVENMSEEGGMSAMLAWMKIELRGTSRRMQSRTRELEQSRQTILGNQDLDRVGRREGTTSCV